ncbi:MAG: ABC transporter substrate-binding protein [Brevinema sp.]
MMRYLSLFILLFTLSCSQSSEKVKLYMWTDNIPQDVYDDFTKETGIRVVEDAISSNEEMYTKIKSSTGSYDIVTPSLDYAEIMIKEGLADEIDMSAIPNITNIDPQIMKSIAVIDPEKNHVVPFAFGPTVIAYDTTRVTDPVNGFDIFSNPKYKGRMSLLNDMREVVGSALLYLGYDISETNEAAMTRLNDLLADWKSNILRFDSDSFHIAYANGEVDIVQGYPDTIIPSLSPEKLANTKFVIANKGAMMWIDSFLILKNAPNKEAALKFIDFIHRPDIYARIMDYISSLSLNVAARELMEIESPVSYKDLERANMLKALDDETLGVHSRLWENIQAQ